MPPPNLTGQLFPAPAVKPRPAGSSQRQMPGGTPGITLDGAPARLRSGWLNGMTHLPVRYR